jgi:hypothetical protein
VCAASMPRSQAALWTFTGSWETSVFHTLLAGNAGQPGAPGTVVPAVTRTGAALAGAERGGGAAVLAGRAEVAGLEVTGPVGVAAPVLHAAGLATASPPPAGTLNRCDA